MSNDKGSDDYVKGLRKDIRYQINWIRRDVKYARLRGVKAPSYTAASIESMLLDILARNGGM